MTPKRKRLLRALLEVGGFVALTACVLLAGLWVSSRLRWGGATLLQHLTHNTIEPGGEYQSLRRFREAEQQSEVDIVFIGSSHGYRGFDPRVFDAAGYSSQNLSSTNQTPLNTFYVARRYLERLSPRLVVFEVYYATLDNDGVEACRDLLVNTPWSWSMMRMAVATRNLDVVTYALAKGLALTPDEGSAEQRPIEGEIYVPGGYCETHATRASAGDLRPFSAAIDDRQLRYLAASSALARSFGAQVVWVSHPLPSDHLAALENRREIEARIAAAAESSGVAHWDYSDRLELDPLAHFRDFHHLNAEGVRRFNRALLEDLLRSELLASTSPRGR